MPAAGGPLNKVRHGQTSFSPFNKAVNSFAKASYHQESATPHG
jgi:hypothetical protein